MAEGRLKGKERYTQGFTPAFHPELLAKKFRPGAFVFVSSMGDISFATKAQVSRILNVVRSFPDTSFLFCTKDPEAYLHWEDLSLPQNLYLGATIETNVVYPGVSHAPAPFNRYRALGVMGHPRKFVSVEPVMDFDLKVMERWFRDIEPQIVEVGADNYGHSLQEPDAEKLATFLEKLRTFVPTVVEKDGLARLQPAGRK
ncbi:MAG: hypothetical protein PHQ43_10070 [Dehalococcoidales bacterium]|nr:hypothetical protein [Dehalococcoidales bacterium]